MSSALDGLGLDRMAIASAPIAHDRGPVGLRRDHRRDGRRGHRTASRGGARATGRRGYAFPRAEHRHPVLRQPGAARQPPDAVHHRLRRRRRGAGGVPVRRPELGDRPGPGRRAGHPADADADRASSPPTPPAAQPDRSASRPTSSKPATTPRRSPQKFRIKTDDLMAANNIDDPQKLQIGQTLKIPAAPRATTSGLAGVLRPRRNHLPTADGPGQGVHQCLPWMGNALSADEPTRPRTRSSARTARSAPRVQAVRRRSNQRRPATYRLVA